MKPAPSSDKMKEKHKLNISDTRDDTILHTILFDVHRIDQSC